MMHRRSRLALPLLIGLTIAACGGEPDEETIPVEASVEDDLSCYIQRGSAADALERPSPLRETPLTVGGHPGLLCYGAVSARGRTIMGGLLVYGQPERIGANEPTTIHLAGPATVGGVALQPGSYSIYAVPDEEEWVFFINSSWERWGIPIDSTVRASEIGSFTATPEPTEEFLETLQYRFEPMANNTMGDVVMEWENTRLRFHVHPGV